MSDVHRTEPLELAADAPSADALTVDEAMELSPSQVKGPSIAERAMDEVHAVVDSAKEAVAGLFSRPSDKGEVDGSQ